MGSTAKDDDMDQRGDGEVVITGFGVVTPAGNDRESAWRGLVEGRSGVGPITAFDVSTLPVRIAHATGTRAGDAAETSAIRQAFGPAAGKVAVSSPTSVTGHLIGTAGSLSVMACALAIRDGVVPPTINLTSPDDTCDLDYLPNAARPMWARTATANAFGFGGQNCVVVFTAPG